MLLFSNITKPLNKLLMKNTKLQWSTQFQSDFGHLMNELCKILILQYPNVHKPFTLFTDTGNYAYSGILTQAVDGPDDLRPVSYTSGSFSDTQ